MFVTSHITFGQLSKFAGGSLEVTRTIRNNKLHFTWGCSILLLKKKKKGEGPETGFLFFFFNDSDFFFSILIQIITYLTTHYSQIVFCGFSILICIGVQVFFRVFFFHSSSCVWLALVLASHLPPFDGKTLKNCACSAEPGLLNETKGSCFPLSCLSSYQNGWQEQTFFLPAHQHSDKEVFLGELV